MQKVVEFTSNALENTALDKRIECTKYFKPGFSFKCVGGSFFNFEGPTTMAVSVSVCLCLSFSVCAPHLPLSQTSLPHSH